MKFTKVRSKLNISSELNSERKFGLFLNPEQPEQDGPGKKPGEKNAKKNTPAQPTQSPQNGNNSTQSASKEEIDQLAKEIQNIRDHPPLYPYGLSKAQYDTMVQSGWNEDKLLQIVGDRFTAGALGQDAIKLNIEGYNSQVAAWKENLNSLTEIYKTKSQTTVGLKTADANVGASHETRLGTEYQANKALLGQQHTADQGLIGTRYQSDRSVDSAGIQADAQKASSLYQSLPGLLQSSVIGPSVKDLETYNQALVNERKARKADLFTKGMLWQGLEAVGQMPSHDVILTNGANGSRQVLHVPIIKDIQVTQIAYKRDGSGSDTEEFSVYTIPKDVQTFAAKNTASLKAKKAEVDEKLKNTPAPKDAGPAGFVINSDANPELAGIKGAFFAGKALFNVPETGDNAPVKVSRRKDSKAEGGYSYFYVHGTLGTEIPVKKEDLFLQIDKSPSSPVLKNGEVFKNAYVPFDKETESLYFEGSSSSKVRTSFFNNLNQLKGNKHAAMGLAELDGEEGGGFFQKIMNKLKMWSRLKGEEQDLGGKGFFGFLVSLFTGKKGSGQNDEHSHSGQLAKAQGEIQNILQQSTQVNMNQSQQIETNISINQDAAKQILALAKKNGIGIEQLIAKSVEKPFGTDADGKVASKEFSDAVTKLLSEPNTQSVQLSNDRTKKVLTDNFFNKKEQNFVEGIKGKTEQTERDTLLSVLTDNKVEKSELTTLAKKLPDANSPQFKPENATPTQLAAHYGQNLTIDAKLLEEALTNNANSGLALKRKMLLEDSQQQPISRK